MSGGLIGEPPPFDHLVVRLQQQLLGASQAVLWRVILNMRPDFVARIDEILVFALLSPNARREICELIVKAETARPRTGGSDLEVSREALESLLREDFNPLPGARPTRKAVERNLQDAVVRDLFATGCGRGRIVPMDRIGRLSIERRRLGCLSKNPHGPQGCR